MDENLDIEQLEQLYANGLQLLAKMKQTAGAERREKEALQSRLEEERRSRERILKAVRAVYDTERGEANNG